MLFRKQKKFSEQRLVYFTATAKDIPPESDGKGLDASALFEDMGPDTPPPHSGEVALLHETVRADLDATLGPGLDAALGSNDPAVRRNELEIQERQKIPAAEIEALKDSFLTELRKKVPPRPHQTPENLAKYFAGRFQKDFAMREEIIAAVARGKISNLHHAVALMNFIKTSRRVIDFALFEALLHHWSDLNDSEVEALIKDKTPPGVLTVLAKDSKSLLNKDQVGMLVSGFLEKEKIPLLEANIDHPEMKAEYVQRIFDLEATKELSHRGEIYHYFPMELLGRGGVGEANLVAYYKPPAYELHFVAAKKALPKTLEKGLGLTTEAKVIAEILDAQTQGRSIPFAVPVHMASNKGDTLMSDVAFRINERGEREHKNVLDLANEVTYPAEKLYSMIADGAENVWAIAEILGRIDFDYKSTQIIAISENPGEDHGERIDFGSMVRSKDIPGLFLMGNMPPSFSETPEPWIDEATGARRGDRYYGVHHGRIPMGSVDGKAQPIGVTSGYFSEAIFEDVKRDPARHWKILAYALGMQIYELQTGNVLKEQIYRNENEDYEGEIVYTGKLIGVNANEIPARPLEDENKNQALMALAKELMDPKNFTTTMPIAIAKLRKILQS